MRAYTQILIISLILILLLGGCEKNQNEGEIVTKAKQLEAPVSASLRTDDSQVIKATFYPNNDSNKGIILLHQFNKDKSSWKGIVNELQKTHNVLAIDLRGHGESSGDLSKFTDIDFNNMKLDLKASREYLIRKGIMPDQISYMGASIGANTVQNFVSENSFDKAILLSPGENFKGIVMKIQDNSVLAIASEEDTYSFQTLKKLERVSPTTDFIYLQNKGHGTNMLEPDLNAKIIKYLNE